MFKTAPSPSSWSGSRADVIAERAASIAALLTHDSFAVREAAMVFLARASEIERQECDWEEQCNNEDSQSFE
jgi:hypothetical protein